MRKTLISILLATVAMPLTAIAQTQTVPEGSEPAAEAPAATTEEPAADATAEEPAPTDDDATTTTTAEEPAPADDAATTTAEEPAAADDAATTAAEEPAAADDEAAGEKLAGEDDVEGPFVTVPMTGAWRVSNLDGKSVEDANGESIGDISDVLVNEKGEVIAVLVGVGGFLGIGEKNVAVAMNALEFGPGKTEGLPTEAEVEAEAEMQVPATGATTPMAPTTGATTTAPAAPEPQPPIVGEDNLPDRIVLNVTREQLEAAPAYEDVEEGVAGEMAPDAPAPAPAEPQPAQ